MAATQFAYDVFLCHSSKDHAAALNIATRLANDGLRVALPDDKSLPLGAPDDTEKSLIQSRTLVMLMSAEAFSADWEVLWRQTALFKDFGDPSNAERRFIPVRLDETEVKDVLEQFAYVDWRQESDEQYAKLLGACRPPSKSANQLGDETLLVAESEDPLNNYDAVVRVSVASNGRWAASNSGDSVRSWDLQSGKCVAVLKGHEAPVVGVAITADGALIVSGSHDRTVRVWDNKSRSCVSVLSGHTREVYGVAVTLDGRTAVSGSLDSTVRVWDIHSKKCVSSLEGHAAAVHRLAIAENGQYVASSSEDRSVRVWRLPNGPCIAKLEGHTSKVSGVAISRDGGLLVSGSTDTTLRVWDVNSSKCVATLEGHTREVSGVELTSDGKRAISSSLDGTCVVWDLETGKRLAILRAHTGWVGATALTSDDRWLVSGSHDNDASTLESRADLANSTGKESAWPALHKCEGAASR